MIEENARLGSLLKYEADKNYSREVVTIAEGQTLKMGTILGRVTEDDTYKIVALTKEKTESGTTTIVQADDSELDGSEIVAGVLLSDVDATKASQKALMLARIGAVADDKIIYPDSATDAQKKNILAQLDQRGIITRTGA